MTKQLNDYDKKKKVLDTVESEKCLWTRFLHKKLIEKIKGLTKWILRDYFTGKKKLTFEWYSANGIDL